MASPTAAMSIESEPKDITLMTGSPQMRSSGMAPIPSRSFRVVSRNTAASFT